MADVSSSPDAEKAERSVLVVEDEILIRTCIAEALRDLSLVVVEASSADEAWTFLQSGGRVDLVFTDNLMPGSMTGEQLVKKVKEHHPDLLVVLTSANYVGSYREGRFLPKPYSIYEAAADIAEMVAARRKD